MFQIGIRRFFSIISTSFYNTSYCLYSFSPHCYIAVSTTFRTDDSANPMLDFAAQSEPLGFSVPKNFFTGPLQVFFVILLPLLN